MAFPRKFKKLLEIELNDVETPDYVWLTYAVCACEKDSCGWGGWIIEAPFKETDEDHSSKAGNKVLSFDDRQLCPRCNKDLFRTAASVRYEPSADQTPVLIPGVDYEETPLKFESDGCRSRRGQKKGDKESSEHTKNARPRSNKHL